VSSADFHEHRRDKEIVSEQTEIAVTKINWENPPHE
jgi:hypothetical protein